MKTENSISRKQFFEFADTLHGVSRTGIQGLAAETLIDNQAKAYAHGEVYDRFFDMLTKSAEGSTARDLDILSAFATEVSESYSEGFRAAVLAFEAFGKFMYGEADSEK